MTTNPTPAQRRALAIIEAEGVLYFDGRVQRRIVAQLDQLGLARVRWVTTVAPRPDRPFGKSYTFTEYVATPVARDLMTVAAAALGVVP